MAAKKSKKIQMNSDPASSQNLTRFTGIGRLNQEAKDELANLFVSFALALRPDLHNVGLYMHDTLVQHLTEWNDIKDYDLQYYGSLFSISPHKGEVANQ